MLLSKYLFALCLISVSFATIRYLRHYGLLKTQRPHYAFATFLGNFTSFGIPARYSRIHQGSGNQKQDPDGYYLGVRYLNYMLQHHSGTRSRSKQIPLLVLTTEATDEYKIDRLRREGAIVVQTTKITTPHWLHPGDIRYTDVLTKLRLWQLTSYDKICFIDADIMLTEPLDGIFQDPAIAVQPIRSSSSQTFDQMATGIELPESYVFAALGENYHYDHPIPPSHNIGKMNSGFFVMSPDERLYRLYMSKIQDSATQDWKGGTFPEQDLFDNIHAWTGSMPWQQVHWQWNAHYPTTRDLSAGVRSFHDKFWEDEQIDPDFRSDVILKTMWRDQVDMMEAYYAAQGL